MQRPATPWTPVRFRPQPPFPFARLKALPPTRDISAYSSDLLFALATYSFELVISQPERQTPLLPPEARWLRPETRSNRSFGLSWQ